MKRVGPGRLRIRRPQQSEGNTSAFLAGLTRFTLRHKFVVLGAWVGIGVVLALAFPQLESVVRKQSVDPIPAGVSSFRAFDRMGDAFDEKGAKTTVFVTMENQAGLTAQNRQSYDALVRELRRDKDNVQAVQDFLADPVTKRQGLSSDQKAWYIPVGLSGTLGSPEAADAVHSVRQTAHRIFADTGTTVHVTGPTATFSDQIQVLEDDLLKITVATILLIGVILLVVYRSIFTALLPLIVVGVSLAVGRGILSALGELGMSVSEFTVPFMTAILLGAGVDYSVFLISRYHERLRTGSEPDAALINATSTIGTVILASAATVALAFMSMIFADLSLFKTLGPACAIAILTGFAATVTLFPPILSFAARRGWGMPHPDRTRRYWNRVGVLVIRRPLPLLVLGIVGLTAFSLVAATMTITYDDRKGQPESTDSNQGYALIDRHFPKDVVIGQYLVVDSPHDLRTARGLADLDQMASRIAQIHGVKRVVGVTRPTGEKLNEAQLSWQNGQIGSKLASSVREGRSREGQLQQLKSGAHQLSDGLNELHNQVRANLIPLTGVLDRALNTGSQISQYTPLLKNLSEVSPALDQISKQAPQIAKYSKELPGIIGSVSDLLPLISNASWCTQIPQCSALRDQVRNIVQLKTSGFFDGMLKLSTTLANLDTPVATVISSITSAVDSLKSTLGTIENENITAKLSQLEDGIAQLASGARVLASGVDALVDNNLETLAGMGLVATQLQESARETQGSEAATGFYLPTNTFDNQNFSDISRIFISPDGHTVRYAIQTDYDPYSAEAMDLSEEISKVANAARPNTSLQESEVMSVGFPAVNHDLKRLLGSDFKLLIIATITIVGLIMMALLRAVVAPLYLLGTVVLNYLSALGVGVLVFQYGLNTEIAWPVPLITFIVLVAVGADYNMLLISRLREEARHGTRVGVLRTVTSTGSVITAAGLIFAASMFGLMTGSIHIMTQVGLIIGVGLLIDTFIVRTIVVPAIAVFLGDANWWPCKPPTMRDTAAAEVDSGSSPSPPRSTSDPERFN